MIDLARKFIPQKLRYIIQKIIPMTKIKIKYRELNNPLSYFTGSENNKGNYSIKLGIIKNQMQYHTYYVSACMELGVPFTVIDLYRSDWLKNINDSKVDIILFWPDAFISEHLKMMKDRMYIVNKYLKIPVFPTESEVWMYEDKRRMAYWCEANNVDYPRTRIFYDLKEALEFSRECELPIVCKLPFGASATGVKIIRKRSQLIKIVKQSFKKGYVASGGDLRDRQWGYVYFQEYLADVKEWRIVRIGDIYFCRQKEKVGEYHSGSGLVTWAKPDFRVLDYAVHITNIGGFRGMAIDIFETENGDLFVNELQTVFGAIQDQNIQRGNEHMGKWYLNSENKWCFEAGYYYQNACANERIKYIISNHLIK